MAPPAHGPRPSCRSRRKPPALLLARVTSRLARALEWVERRASRLHTTAACRPGRLSSARSARVNAVPRTSTTSRPAVPGGAAATTTRQHPSPVDRRADHARPVHLDGHPSTRRPRDGVRDRLHHSSTGAASQPVRERAERRPSPTGRRNPALDPGRSLACTGDRDCDSPDATSPAASSPPTSSAQPPNSCVGADDEESQNPVVTVQLRTSSMSKASCGRARRRCRGSTVPLIKRQPSSARHPSSQSATISQQTPARWDADRRPVTTATAVPRPPPDATAGGAHHGADEQRQHRPEPHDDRHNLIQSARRQQQIDQQSTPGGLAKTRCPGAKPQQ